MKKIFKILTLIMLIFTILKISGTYAKYYTRATAIKEQEIAKWKIKVHELDIYSETGEVKTFSIDKITNFSNPNAVANKISPGSEGYLEIEIDPTGTDVAIRYDIETVIPETLEMPASITMGASNTDNPLIKTGENKYTGIISLSDIQAGQIDTVKWFVDWSNDEENNANDTTTGSIYGNTFSDINIKVTITQYLGEEITAYIG